MRHGGGRFLQTDPIEGGSANDYDYVNQDPINGLDLGGTCLEDACIVEGTAAGVGIYIAGAAVVGSIGWLVSGGFRNVIIPQISFPHINFAKKNTLGGVAQSKSEAVGRAKQTASRFNNRCPPGRRAAFRGPCSQDDSCD